MSLTADLEGMHHLDSSYFSKTEEVQILRQALPRGTCHREY